MAVQESGPAPEADSIEVYTFESFRVEVIRRRLLRDDQPISLPSRVFDLLVHLLRHHGEVVDKDALIRVGWADAFVTEDSLTHGISVLRRALRDDSTSPRFIVTLPRRGYQFVGPVKALDGAAEDTARTPAPSEPVTEARILARRPRLWVAAAVAGVIIILVTVWGNNEEARSLPRLDEVVSLAQPPPPGTTLVSGGVLSHDGRQMAFVARDLASGGTHVWVRPLNSFEPMTVKGTDGASRPFWSPRADAFGYFVGNKLMVASLAGDPPREITSGIVHPNGGSWGTGDVILFGDSGRGIYAVPATGGQARQVTTVDYESEMTHTWPNFLPDGRRFLYSVHSGDSARRGTWVGYLDPGERSSLRVAEVTGAVYAPPGYLLYVQRNSLMAIPFDPATLQLGTVGRIVARNVPQPRLPGVDPVSASGSMLSFRAVSRPDQLTWFDRSGRRIGTVATPTTVHNPALSSDERSLVVAGSSSDEPGLWLIDLDRNVPTLLEAEGAGPVISPDDTQVAYTARGGLDIRVRNLVGQADERTLLRDDRRKAVLDWSPDGRYLVFSTMDAEAGLDLWMLYLSGSPDPVQLLASPANERGARISPDGRWFAYTSDESGTLEVYVQEFPGLGSKRTLSVGVGVGPVWTRGGRELLYLSVDRRLMAVEFGPTGPRAPTRPIPLFSLPLPGDVWQARNYYVVSGDGERILVNAVGHVESSPITVVVNWLVAGGS